MFLVFAGESKGLMALLSLMLLIKLPFQRTLFTSVARKMFFSVIISGKQNFYSSIFTFNLAVLIHL